MPATVIVSAFPPLRDGIARYAGQLANHLQEERRTQRLGLPGSDADRVVQLRGGLRPLRLLVYTRRRQEVILMWHPDYFLAGGSARRTVGYVALAIALGLRRSVVVVHEFGDFPTPERGWRRIAGSSERVARRRMWRSVSEIRCHNRSQLRGFIEAMGAPELERRTTFIDHGSHYAPAVQLDRASARRTLNLPPEGHVFLCIGFIGRYKGFDRAIHAMRELDSPHAHLYVVGSSFSDHPDNAAYIAELRDAVAMTPRATLCERYVDDAEFDTWLLAADTVLLPYRSVLTSAVGARARMLGTPMIAAAVDAFPEEIGPADRLFDRDCELPAAMEARIEEQLSAR